MDEQDIIVCRAFRSGRIETGVQPTWVPGEVLAVPITYATSGEASRVIGTLALAERSGGGAFTREEQDRFALASLSRALAANNDGTFGWEIAPVTVAGRKGEVVIDKDEQPAKATPDKIPTLKPAFRKDGTVTAANSSSISDGAAALVLMRRSTAEQRGLTPLAVIVAHAVHAAAPGDFPTAPVGAIAKVHAKSGWTSKSVDLYEVNEAFAVVTMAAMREHAIEHERMNVHGGACALGHPIGASGARIVVTLLGALRKHGKRRGVASLCIGGGEATALVVEGSRRAATAAASRLDRASATKRAGWATSRASSRRRS